MREEHLRRIEEIAAAKAQAAEMGGAEAVAKQHARGKLTCRERLDLLLDPGSFVELGILAQSVVKVPGKATKVARAAGVTGIDQPHIPGRVQACNLSVILICMVQ